MVEFPKKAEVNKVIPKNTFYRKVNISSSIKNEFTNLIEKIIWEYKISEETTGIKKTDNICEIQVFKINLKEKVIPRKILQIIIKSIPYPILFKLSYEEDKCYAIALYDKEQKYEKLYINDWNQKLDFDLKVLNLNSLYKKIVKQFILEFDETEKFEETIHKNTLYEELNNDIIKLSNQIKKEKQFNRKFNLNKKLNQKKKELEELING